MQHSETVSVRYMVDDVEQAVAFYTDLLDFEVLTNAGSAFADVKNGNLRLLISGPKSSAGRPMPDGATPGPGGWNRIHFIVDDLVTEVDRLRDAAQGSATTSSKVRAASRSSSRTRPATSSSCSSPRADPLATARLYSSGRREIAAGSRPASTNPPRAASSGSAMPSASRSAVGGWASVDRSLR